MIQTGFDNRVKIHQIVENQLPSFILEENPNASEFLKQYYISQEYQGGPVDISDNLDQYLKLDNLTPEVVVDSTILSNDITSSETTIQVSSTKGFPNQYGLLKIDDEIITYTGITATSFTGCIRGFSGITNYHDNLTNELVFSSSDSQSHSANSSIQNLVAETQLMKTDLIQPIFIKEGLKGIEQIESLPGINRYGSDAVLNEVEDLANLNIGAIAIFPVIDPTKKDNHGSEATNDNNFLINEIKKIKAEFPEMLLISDVALDPYTTHGHDGILDESGYVDNDKTLKILRDQSLILAEAGADIIAPSDMMDGRVGVIRDALEKNGFINTIILSYAAKYNSQFYGPFRDAVGSSANLGKSSKSSYQMAFTNSDEALHEVALDIKEGADIVMVKPGMPYLDIIYRIKKEFKIPTFAYQVSGEYSMIKNAIEKGWIDRGVMLESLTSLKRAGSDAILTYAAKEISKELL